MDRSVPVARRPLRRAARYMRMSTEHQNYSLEHQAVFLATFAVEHGYEIVRSYVDAGVSGLRLKGRDSLKALLADILGGRADFDTVLVYDVSRWGRFQDLDQAGHYEFLCREAGVQIVYAAEPFGNDCGLGSVIVKHLKRAMAAEYSRELGVKISRCKRNLSRHGFWMEGAPGYGLRRVAVDPERTRRMAMERGEHKALQGFRTILVPGPEEEVRTVRRIYSLFLVHGLHIRAIAALLNREGVTAEGGARWTRYRVVEVLRNEKYAGALLRGKTRGALGLRQRAPRSAWVRIPEAVEPIVDARTFAAVDAQFRKRKSVGPSDAELLDDVRLVLKEHGRISRALLDAHPKTHCAAVIARRFGGLVGALRRAGVEPTDRQLAASEHARRTAPTRYRTPSAHPDPAQALTLLREHLARTGHISGDTIDDDPALPRSNWYRQAFGSLGRAYQLVGYEPRPNQKIRIEFHARKLRAAGKATEALPAI